MKLLLIVAIVLLICIGPTLVLVAAMIRNRQAAARRRGFDVDTPDRFDPGDRWQGRRR